MQGKNNDTSITEKFKNAIQLDEVGFDTDYSSSPTTADDLRESSASINERRNVVLGKNITDKLKFLYHYNIDDRLNVVKANYTLSKRWTDQGARR